MNIEGIRTSLRQLDHKSAEYATQFADQLLQSAVEASASDIHVQPVSDALEVRWRLDGVLQTVGVFPHGEQTNVVARLKVLADLLTYRTDVPQEGRIRGGISNVEMRVSTFPTLYGERAVVRLLAFQNSLQQLSDLGLPQKTTALLQNLLLETTGALLITGPAGSGKTTTAYACLREMADSSQGGRSIVSLEDPIEMSIAGVSQSQVNLAAGFDLVSGLKSMLRQDPEVMLVGEMRDKPTAEIAIQAALTGQFVVTTFHAGTVTEALDRLVDMGIEPYLVRNAVLAVLSQRLLRRLCSCASESSSEHDLLGLPIPSTKIAVGCEKCGMTGYAGRAVISELLQVRGADAGAQAEPRFVRLSPQQGMVSLGQSAIAAVQDGITSAAEVRRVLGFRSDLAPLEK
ncbi:MAG: type II/IV secretion system protein [Planctomycetales bacterium]|nr:type II/IV secretion system protein [Planctomycetales bacterium]